MKAVKRWFEKLERQKQTVLADVAGLSAAQLAFRPEASWSVLNVLDHLVKVEKAFVANVHGHLPNGMPVTLRDRVGGMAVIFVMQSPMRVKVPPAASMVLPEATVTLPETGARWAEVREEMADLLGSLRPEQSGCGLFRHPIGGWMTMARGLQFLSAHMRHHGYQLNRLKSAIRDI
jgi:hypothetical protein